MHKISFMDDCLLTKNDEVIIKISSSLRLSTFIEK